MRYFRVIRFCNRGLRETHELGFCEDLPDARVNITYVDRELVPSDLVTMKSVPTHQSAGDHGNRPSACRMHPRNDCSQIPAAS